MRGCGNREYIDYLSSVLGGSLDEEVGLLLAGRERDVLLSENIFRYIFF